MRVLLPLAAALSALALSAQSPLTTTFAGGSCQSGNMFDVQATNPAGITVQYFEVNLSAGTWDVEVYAKTVPGPYLPSVNVAADWTLKGTALGVVSNGPGVPTIVPVAVCEYIPPTTTQSFYVTVTTANVCGLNYTNSGVTGTVFASNSDLNFYAGAGLSYPFTGNFNPRVFNGNIYYVVGPDPGCATGLAFAAKSKYGAACYNDPRMVHEYWPVNSTIDLVNTSWILAYNPGPTGGNYTVTPGAPAYDGVTPAVSGVDLPTLPYTTSSSLNWDDASINMTLPVGLFPTGFPYPNAANATAVDISVNSNGRIYLGSHFDNSFDSNGANSGYVPTSFQGTTGVGFPMIAGFMNDMDPTIAGSHIWYEDPSPSGGVRITWDNVPNWQDTAAGAPLAVANYIQMELLPNGIVFLAFGPSLGNGGSSTNEAITGYSPGMAEPFSTPVDWSAITSLMSGTGPGVTIDASARPVLGSTINVTTDRIPAGSLVGGQIYGLTPVPTGFPLIGLLGIPCDLYATLDLLTTAVLPGPTYTNPFAIPATPSLAGGVVAVQGFALNALIPNPLGAVMSEGLLLTLGN